MQFSSKGEVFGLLQGPTWVALSESGLGPLIKISRVWLWVFVNGIDFIMRNFYENIWRYVEELVYVIERKIFRWEKKKKKKKKERERDVWAFDFSGTVLYLMKRN